mmetsp:Transcript_69434/g.160888  ORF Transcript_69434/g.160888 Transcript_69434/m.160888 type:complete len:133 (+) Transcript_69434:66-464(+)
MALLRCSLLLCSLFFGPAAAKFVARSSSAACPSTEVYYTKSEDAAGTPVWLGPLTGLIKPDTCKDVAESGIKAVKVCGPGAFMVSRMSCNNHEYKAITMTHPKEDFTKGDCKVYEAKGTNVEGYLGSVSYKC